MQVDPSPSRPNRPPLDEKRRKALEDYRKKLSEYRDVEERLRERKKIFLNLLVCFYAYISWICPSS